MYKLMMREPAGVSVASSSHAAVAMRPAGVPDTSSNRQAFLLPCSRQASPDPLIVIDEEHETASITDLAKILRYTHLMRPALHDDGVTDLDTLFTSTTPAAPKPMLVRPSATPVGPVSVLVRPSAAPVAPVTVLVRPVVPPGALPPRPSTTPAAPKPTPAGPVVPPGALPPRLSAAPVGPRSVLVRPVVPPVALLPPPLPLPSAAVLPIAKALHKHKLAPQPLASLGPPLMTPQPPRQPPPRVMYGPRPPNYPPPMMVHRSRSPPRGPLVQRRRWLRTPSRSPPAAQRHP
jgi:hypothetical protein